MNSFLFNQGNKPLIFVSDMPDKRWLLFSSGSRGVSQADEDSNLGLEEVTSLTRGNWSSPAPLYERNAQHQECDQAEEMREYENEAEIYFPNDPPPFM